MNLCMKAYCKVFVGIPFFYVPVCSTDMCFRYLCLSCPIVNRFFSSHIVNCFFMLFFSCSCLFWINHLVSFAEKFGSGLAVIFSVYAPTICGFERHFIFGFAPGRNKSLIKWTKKTLDKTLEIYVASAHLSRFLPPRRKIRHVGRWVTKTHKTTNI